eukprot:Ihof_evm19s22 gene=Ihof_evmTU19s22
MEYEGILETGLEVSAKYKGAFCEAVISTVEPRLEARVDFTVKSKGSHWIDHENINGAIGLHKQVEAKHPSDGQYHPGTIIRIADNSIYTVVFDDADVRTVKRQAIHTKACKPDWATPEKVTPHDATAPSSEPIIGRIGRYTTEPSPEIGTRRTPAGHKPAPSTQMKKPSGKGARKKMPKGHSIKAVPSTKVLDSDTDDDEEALIDSETLEKRVAVFVNTTDFSFWRPALVVPNDEIDKTMPKKVKPSDYIVRFFDDFSYRTVPRNALRLFFREAPLFRLFMQIDHHTFSTNEGVKNAMIYVETGHLPDGACWAALRLPKKKTANIYKSPSLSATKFNRNANPPTTTHIPSQTSKMSHKKKDSLSKTEESTRFTQPEDISGSEKRSTRRNPHLFDPTDIGDPQAVLGEVDDSDTPSPKKIEISPSNENDTSILLITSAIASHPTEKKECDPMNEDIMKEQQGDAGVGIDKYENNDNEDIDMDGEGSGLDITPRITRQQHKHDAKKHDSHSLNSIGMTQINVKSDYSASTPLVMEPSESEYLHTKDGQDLEGKNGVHSDIRQSHGIHDNKDCVVDKDGEREGENELKRKKVVRAGEDMGGIEKDEVVAEGMLGLKDRQDNDISAKQKEVDKNVPVAKMENERETMTVCKEEEVNHEIDFEENNKEHTGEIVDELECGKIIVDKNEGKKMAVKIDAKDKQDEQQSGDIRIKQTSQMHDSPAPGSQSSVSEKSDDASSEVNTEGPMSLRRASRSGGNRVTTPVSEAPRSNKKWRFRLHDKVWALSYYDGKVYLAKVVNRKLMTSGRAQPSARNPATPHYFVHYSDWASKYDEWIEESQIYTENPNVKVSNKGKKRVHSHEVQTLLIECLEPAEKPRLEDDVDNEDETIEVKQEGSSIDSTGLVERKPADLSSSKSSKVSHKRKSRTPKQKSPALRSVTHESPVNESKQEAPSGRISRHLTVAHCIKGGRKRTCSESAATTDMERLRKKRGKLDDIEESCNGMVTRRTNQRYLGIPGSEELTESGRSSDAANEDISMDTPNSIDLLESDPRSPTDRQGINTRASSNSRFLAQPAISDKTPLIFYNVPTVNRSTRQSKRLAHASPSEHDMDDAMGGIDPGVSEGNTSGSTGMEGLDKRNNRNENQHENINERTTHSSNPGRADLYPSADTLNVPFKENALAPTNYHSPTLLYSPCSSSPLSESAASPRYHHRTVRGDTSPMLSPGDSSVSPRLVGMPRKHAISESSSGGNHPIRRNREKRKINRSYKDDPWDGRSPRILSPTLTAGMPVTELEQRMQLLKQQYLEHKTELARLDKIKRSKARAANASNHTPHSHHNHGHLDNDTNISRGDGVVVGTNNNWHHSDWSNDANIPDQFAYIDDVCSDLDSPTLGPSRAPQTPGTETIVAMETKESVDEKSPMISHEICEKDKSINKILDNNKHEHKDSVTDLPTRGHILAPRASSPHAPSVHENDNPFLTPCLKHTLDDTISQEPTLPTTAAKEMPLVKPMDEGLTENTSSFQCPEQCDLPPQSPITTLPNTLQHDWIKPTVDPFHVTRVDGTINNTAGNSIGDAVGEVAMDT